MQDHYIWQVVLMLAEWRCTSMESGAQYATKGGV